jgi:hypothetical protein
MRAKWGVLNAKKVVHTLADAYNITGGTQTEELQTEHMIYRVIHSEETPK